MTKHELTSEVDARLAEIRELCMSVIEDTQGGLDSLDLVNEAARFLRGQREAIRVLKALESIFGAKPPESTAPAGQDTDATVLAFKSKGTKTTH